MSRYDRVVCVLATVTVPLAGCWSGAPRHTPLSGSGRLIDGPIHVATVEKNGVVRSADAKSNTIVIGSSTGQASAAYRVSSRVSGLDQVVAGDRARVEIAQDLNIYRMIDGPGSKTDSPPASVNAAARVASVDVSYRLLTLEYPDSRQETFKIKRGVPLKSIRPGDSVVITHAEISAMRIKGR